MFGLAVAPALLYVIGSVMSAIALFLIVIILKQTGKEKGLSGTLSLAFSAELDGSDEITWDTEELSEACWMDRKEIPPVPNEESITMKIISAFRRGEW